MLKSIEQIIRPTLLIHHYIGAMYSEWDIYHVRMRASVHTRTQVHFWSQGSFEAGSRERKGQVPGSMGFAIFSF